MQTSQLVIIATICHILPLSLSSFLFILLPRQCY